MPFAADITRAFQRYLRRDYTVPPLALIAPLMVGVFFVFMQVGWVSSLARTRIDTFGASATHAAIGGLIAVGFALATAYRKWWGVLLTVAFMVFGSGRVFGVVAGVGGFGEATDQAAARAAVMWASMASLSIGFWLVMRSFSDLRRRAAEARAELDLAAGIHRTLVPAIDMKLVRAEVFGVSRASSTMGGDLIEVVRHDAGDDVIIADVSGHGVKAGVVMAMVKASLRTSIAEGGTLDQAVRRVDAVLSATIDDGMFVTLAAVRIPREGPGEVALAGHPPVLVRSASGEVRRIMPDHPPLGLGIEDPALVRSVVLLPGDTLALVTDGLAETQDRAGRFFGDERIERAFAASAPTLEGLSRAVMAEVAAFGTQKDDQSLLLVRITS
jgi:hypothetical protein